MSSHEKKFLKTAVSPVSEALILVCEKCGKKLTSPETPDLNPAREMQQNMKHQIKEQLGKGVVRALISSCLDICPKDEVTVAVLRTDGGKQQAEFFTVGKDHLKAAESEIIAHALRE